MKIQSRSRQLLNGFLRKNHYEFITERAGICCLGLQRRLQEIESSVYSVNRWKCVNKEYISFIHKTAKWLPTFIKDYIFVVGYGRQIQFQCPNWSELSNTNYKWMPFQKCSLNIGVGKTKWHRICIQLIVKRKHNPRWRWWAYSPIMKFMVKKDAVLRF